MLDLIIPIIGLLLIKCQGEQLAPPLIISFKLGSTDSTQVALSPEDQLTCVPAVSGSPAPIISYFKDDQLIAQGNMYKQRVTTSDAGVYWIVANNSLGAAISPKVRLSIYYTVPWDITIPAERKSLIRGQGARLLVPTIQAYPQPSAFPQYFSWLNGDTNSTLTVDQHSHISLSMDLVILDAPIEYNGLSIKAKYNNLYVDAVTVNQGYVLSVTADTSPRSQPLSLVIPLPNITTIEKSVPQVKLECIVNASPIQELHTFWYRIPRGGGIRQMLVSTLSNANRTIEILTKQIGLVDQDRIECNAVLGNQSVVSQTTISILEPPSISPVAQIQYEVDLNTQFSLPCVSQGNPAPSIKWYKNAETVIPGNRVSISPNGSLTLFNIGISDSAVYQCVALNIVGESWTSFFVKIISSPPAVLTAPSDVSAVTGQTVRMACIASGKPEPSVQWIFRSAWGNEETVLGNGGRFRIDSSGLNISLLTWLDSGTYVCRSSNSLGIVEKQALLLAYNSTSIVTSSSNLEEEKGTSVTRYCNVSKDNRVTATVLWFQNGTPLVIDPLYRSLNNENQRLHFEALRTLVDQGLFCCSVYSAVGNDSKCHNITVLEVPHRPEPVAALSTAKSRTILLSWRTPYNGNRPIQFYIIRMRENNQAWANLTSILPALTYEVQNLKPSKMYQFTITAQNSYGLGQESQATEVIIIPPEPPSAPPLYISVTPLSPTSVRMRWRPPPDDAWNGELRGYYIQYSLNLQPSTWRTQAYESPSSGEMSFDLERLSVYTEYYVRIAAFNINGTGPYGDPQKTATLEGIPTMPPSIVFAYPISSTAINVTWQWPPLASINGLTRGFTLKAIAGSSDPVTKEVGKTQQEYETSIIDGLGKFVMYNVSITLNTNGGKSPAAWTRVTTLQDIPEKVNSLQLQGKTHNSLTITWLAPVATNGILTGYNVTVTQGNFVNSSFIKANETTVVFAGLESSTTYLLLVSAATVVGNGPASSVEASTRPPPDPPNPPTNLEVSGVTSRTAVLRFTPGFDGLAPVHTWIVESRAFEDQAWLSFQQFDNDPETRTLQISGLQPYSSFSLRLIAENIAGRSNSSRPTTLYRTLMDKPSHPPRNLTVRAHNHTTLIISWEALSYTDFNGEPVGYLIAYSASFSDHRDERNVTDPNVRFLILGDLKPYTSYNITIVAMNREFHSEESQPATARTIESVPGSGPIISAAVVLSSTEVQVTWNTLPQNQSNGILLGYRLIFSSDQSIESSIDASTNTTVILSDLAKFTSYQLKVKAYTRIGDGPPSDVVQVTTLPGVPGPISRLSFTRVEETSASFSWMPPEFVNGPGVLKYRLRYKGNFTDAVYTLVTDHSSTSYVAQQLQKNTYYTFSVCAENSLGSGVNITATVKTSLPESQNVPATPQLFSSISAGATNLTLRWQRGSDGGLPIRNYSLWLKANSSSWTIGDYIPGEMENFVIKRLHPDTPYTLRLEAVNDIGKSLPTAEIVARTLPARPVLAPIRVLVVPKTEASLTISWEFPVQPVDSGPVTATRVWYEAYRPEVRRHWEDFSNTSVQYPLSVVVLEGLTVNLLYEIRLSSLNSIGYSEATSPLIVFVGVAVPSGAPRNFNGTLAKADSVEVAWEALPASEQNGQLLGYKVYYDAIPETREKRSVEKWFDVVPPESTSHIIKNLQPFTKYLVHITAFNIAGEGPPSLSIEADTDQGLPGPPSDLVFMELTLSLVNVSWNAPAQPNGKIIDYIITYYPFSEDDNIVHVHKHYSRDSRSSSVRYEDVVPAPLTNVLMKLEKKTLYIISVQARTQKGQGESITTNYTSGPHAGVPDAPMKAEFTREDAGMLLHWTYGSSNDAPVSGFVVEALSAEWMLVTRSDTPATTWLLTHYQLNNANVTYSQYRVSLLNALGLGQPTVAVEVVPYFKTWWFLVIIALAALIVLLLIVAVLCCECFRRKVKQVEEAYENDITSLHSETYEMRRSFKRSGGSVSALRSPPRPSPGSLAYSQDEAPPNYEDSSTVTDKADLESDSAEDDDTKSRMSESSSEAGAEKAGAASPSYNHYQYGGYNHFVNSGAVQQSWNNSHHGRNTRDMLSYTDTESMASHSGHTGPSASIHRPPSDPRRNPVLNMSEAGSRAPLQGFSSFV